MKDRIGSLKVLRLSCMVAILLLTIESCYTPWQKAQAEKEAIAQFAVVEESIHIPPDATLLAEVYFHEQDNRFAVAGVERVYMVPRSCVEVIDEYREKMMNSGWTMVKSTGSCDQTIRLYLRARGDLAQFIIQANPNSESPMADRWQLLQNQYQSLYYVFASLAVPYDKPSR